MTNTDDILYGRKVILMGSRPSLACSRLRTPRDCIEAGRKLSA